MSVICSRHTVLSVTSFALQGMVLLSPEINPAEGVCKLFEADIYLLFHTNRIGVGFETTIHVGSLCQTCKIEAIKDKVCTESESASRPPYMSGVCVRPAR